MKLVSAAAAVAAVFCVQIAQRAQKKSVTPEDVVRYEQYNDKHGAKYAEQDGEPEDLEEW